MVMKTSHPRLRSNFIFALAWLSALTSSSFIRAEDFRQAVKQAVPRLVYLRTLTQSDTENAASESDSASVETPATDVETSSNVAPSTRMGFLIGNRLIGAIESAQGDQWQIELADGTWSDIPIAGHDHLTGVVVLRDTRPDAPDLQPLTGGETELALPVVVTWLAEGIPQANATIVTCNGSAQMRGMPSINSLDPPAEQGAPVLSASGELLGLATQIRIASSWRPSMAIAGVGGYPLTLEDQSPIVDLIAPVSAINRLVAAISPDGEPVTLRYGYMGVRVDTETGLIEAVIPEGPAEKSGIRAGDRIAKIGGQEITSQQRIFSILQHYRAGDTLSLLVERQQEDQSTENLDMELTLMAMDASQIAAATPAPDESEGNGLTLRTIDRSAETADEKTAGTTDSPTNITALQIQMQRRLNQYPPEIIVERADLEEAIRQLSKEIEALRAELRDRK